METPFTKTLLHEEREAEHFLQPERALQDKSHCKQPIIKDFSFPPSHLTPPYKKS